MPTVDDIPGDASTTAVAVVGQGATGTIDFASDTDWFRVNLAAGIGYQFIMLDANGEQVFDQSITIYSLSGQELASDRNSSLPFRQFSRLDVFEPNANDIFFVSVGRSTGLATGAYTLVVQPLVDTIPADRTTTQTIAVGGTATGLLETQYDED